MVNKFKIILILQFVLASLFYSFPSLADYPDLPVFRTKEKNALVSVVEQAPSLNEAAEREYRIHYENIDGFKITAERVYLYFDPCDQNKAQIMQDGVKIGHISFSPGRVKIDFKLDREYSEPQQIELIENIDVNGPLVKTKVRPSSRYVELGFRFNERTPAIDFQFISKDEIALLYAGQDTKKYFASLLDPNVQAYRTNEGFEKQEYFAQEQWTRNGKYLWSMAKGMYSHLSLKLSEFSHDWWNAKQEGVIVESGFLLVTSWDLLKATAEGTIDLGKNFGVCSYNMVQEAHRGNLDKACQNAIGGEVSWLLLGLTAKGGIKAYKPTVNFLDAAAQNTYIGLKNAARLIKNSGKTIGMSTPEGSIFIIPAAIELDALIPMGANGAPMIQGALMVEAGETGASGMGGIGASRIIPETVEEGSVIKFQHRFHPTERATTEHGIILRETDDFIQIRSLETLDIVNIKKTQIVPDSVRVLMEPIKPGKFHFIYRTDGTIMEAKVLRVNTQTFGSQTVPTEVVFDLGTDAMGNPIGTKLFSFQKIVSLNKRYIEAFQTTYDDLTMDMAQVINPGKNTIFTPFRSRVWQQEEIAVQAREAAESAVFEMEGIHPIARQNYLARVAERDALRAQVAETEATAVEAEQAAWQARQAADRAKQKARFSEGRSSSTASEIDQIFETHKGDPAFLRRYRQAYDDYIARQRPDAMEIINPDGTNQLAHNYAVSEALKGIQ